MVIVKKQMQFTNSKDVLCMVVRHVIDAIDAIKVVINRSADIKKNIQICC
jgi:hypothetical protein